MVQTIVGQILMRFTQQLFRSVWEKKSLMNAVMCGNAEVWRACTWNGDSVRVARWSGECREARWGEGQCQCRVCRGRHHCWGRVGSIQSRRTEITNNKHVTTVHNTGDTPSKVIIHTVFFFLNANSASKYTKKIINCQQLIFLHKQKIKIRCNLLQEILKWE
jgi:hypothetical protein